MHRGLMIFAAGCAAAALSMFLTREPQAESLDLQSDKATLGHAEVSATAEVFLTSVRGNCVQGMQRAIFRNEKGVVKGCWFSAFEHIWIIFEDGDKVGYKATIFSFRSI